MYPRAVPCEAGWPEKVKIPTRKPSDINQLMQTRMKRLANIWIDNAGNLNLNSDTKFYYVKQEESIQIILYKRILKILPPSPPPSTLNRSNDQINSRKIINK